MADEVLRFIFANAIPAALIRADRFGLSHLKRDLCRTFAVGFGLTEYQGDDIYAHGANTLDTVVGFGDTSHYEGFEAVVRTQVNASAASALTEINKKILTLVVHSIIFGYALNPNIPEAGLYNVIGSTLADLATRITGIQPYEFDRDTGILQHPFTAAVIIEILANNDYTLTIAQLAESEKNFNLELVNYNYYDTTRLFSGPNLDLMKDAENQYYYVSGELIYSEIPNLTFCEEETVDIVTPSGTVTTKYLKNQPCIDENNYIGPRSNIKFYREFNDGPYSSGDFTNEVKSAFVQFDKEKLAPEEYLNNGAKLHTFTRLNSTGGYDVVYNDRILYDINGEYNLTREYLYAPIPTGCSGLLQTMRVGDERVRNQCLEYLDGECIKCVEVPTTGFKFALVELDEEYWGDTLAYSLTNPASSGSRTVKRALNLNPFAYKGTHSGDYIQTYTIDHLGNIIWYFGPPQLSGSNTLPYLAFTNGFNNNTFNERARAIFYPALGTSNGDTNGESTRTFEVSPTPLLTGIDPGEYTVRDGYESDLYPNAKFREPISAYTKGLDDDIRLKFFGMGDAFSGLYSISASAEENAGYFYSGYVITDSEGNVISTPTALTTNYTGYVLGSRIKETRFISGYTGALNIEMAKLYGQSESGKTIQYYYFDNRTAPTSISNITGWQWFSPLPSGVEGELTSEGNPIYLRSYGVQRTENSFPRYYRGPYASVTKKFLYPNASLTNILYDGQTNGFPTKFRYKVIVREETVKELYAKFVISDGIVYDDPEYISVIRPVESNLNGIVIPNIFDCDSAECDFNQWGTSGFLYTLALPDTVDNDYAPITRTWYDGFDTRDIVASGKNNVTYTSSPTFKQGILITGDDITEHRNATGLGTYEGKLFYSKRPAGVGVFHGFTGYELTGEMTYTRPLFNMEQGIVDQTFVNKSLPIMSGGCTSYFVCDGGCSPSIATGLANLYIKNLNGRLFYSSSGQDPFYFENIGGRTGTANATGQGGYHSKGILGDSWMSYHAEAFGYFCTNSLGRCDFGSTPVEGETTDNRVPEEDSRWVMFNSTPSATKIYTRALYYNPMDFDYVHNPYTVDDFLGHSVSGIVNLAQFDSTFESYYFDMSDFFPIRERTGHGEWYYNPSGSGITVGPFNRDVELFAATGSPISGLSQFYVDDLLVFDYFSGVNGATCTPPKYLSGESTVFSDGSLENGLFHNIKTFAYIPSGRRIRINLRSNSTEGVDEGDYVTKIGFPENSIMHFRARKPLNAAEYDSSELVLLGILGQTDWLHNHQLTNNGMERVFSIDHPNGQFTDLVKTHEFVTFSRSGKLYPIPDSTEFAEYKSDDEFGNETYFIDGVEEFWRLRTATFSDTIYSTGWREGSRISFEVVEFEPIYDTYPYEIDTSIVPSGNCIISGEYGYLSQADNSVFSEGVYLVDRTEKDQIRDKIYGPSYVSDVIKRVPMFNMPSGTFISPVLAAPSVMKQRKDRFNISPEQTYSGINTAAPANYNKLLWPALSDLRTLNPDETIEDLPPDDGNTFLNSTMLISASQGQPLPNGGNNPDNRKLYIPDVQYQMYDSIATDSAINFKHFITSGFGFETSLKQPASGRLVPFGTTLTEIGLGLV